jgi:hypothetical protein
MFARVSPVRKDGLPPGGSGATLPRKTVGASLITPLD